MLNRRSGPLCRRSIWIHNFTRYRALYLMLIPGIAYYLYFRYGPMYGAVISFKDCSVRNGILGSPWADPWYAHILKFVNSPYFFKLLRNTFEISLLRLVTSIPLSIGMAIALSEIRSVRYRRILQTVTYLPHFLSWVIMYGIVYAFFSETRGLINMLIREVSGKPVNFMTSTTWFRPLPILSSAWKETGWGAIIYLAAILGIDPALYEASRVDGANRLQAILHITLPGIRSVTKRIKGRVCKRGRSLLGYSANGPYENSIWPGIPSPSMYEIMPL